MCEPCKLTSLHMPYRVYEKAKEVAKEKKLSVNKLVRIAIEDYLKREGVLLEK